MIEFVCTAADIPAYRRSAQSSRAVAWSGAPGRSMRLHVSKLGVDPDGHNKWLVRASFLDASGRETTLLHNGDIEFHTTLGTAQWQTRARFGGPATIVSVDDASPFVVRAEAKAPLTITGAATTIDADRETTLAAKPIGAHTVALGWYPRSRKGVTITRTDGRADVVCLQVVAKSSCRDSGVTSASTAHYRIDGLPGGTRTVAVTLPSELPKQNVSVMNGKGMWLRFSADPTDVEALASLDVPGVVRHAKESGIRYIELRLTYGPFAQVTDATRARVDDIIDEATANGIAIIAWVVPRSTAYDDIALAVDAARYTTHKGSRMAGIAIDYERGEQYLGSGASARSAMAAYAHALRGLLGRSTLIASIVEDPYSNRLSDADVPYVEIATSSNVMQPMTYWRMFQNATSPKETRRVVRRSIAMLRSVMHSNVAINFGGQTTGEGPCGASPPTEIVASMVESRNDGAIGETFFDWTGTLADQWRALSSYPW